MKSVLSTVRSFVPRSLQKGFSLLEIIIVLAIIGMLIGIIVTRIAGGQDKAKISLTATKAADLYSKIIQYQLMNNNQYPASLDTLKGGISPYIQEDEAKDAWGRDFCYSMPADQGGDIFIGSKGKEGKVVTFCYKNGKQQMNTASGGSDNSTEGCTPC